MADRKIRSTFYVQCSTLKKGRMRSPRRLRSSRDATTSPLPLRERARAKVALSNNIPAPLAGEGQGEGGDDRGITEDPG